MKKLLVLLALSFVAITHTPAAQAQGSGTGGYYHADTYLGFCDAWIETYVCSHASTFVTLIQSIAVSRVEVGAYFSGPGYSAWDSAEYHIYVPGAYPFNQGAIVQTYQGILFAVCAHSGWHEVQSTHTADIFVNLFQSIPLWTHHQGTAAYRPYCDCGSMD